MTALGKQKRKNSKTFSEMTGYCQVPLAIKTPAEDPALGSPKQDNSVLQLAATLPSWHRMLKEAQLSGQQPGYWSPHSIGSCLGQKHCLFLALNRSTFGLSLQMTFHGPHC